MRNAPECARACAPGTVYHRRGHAVSQRKTSASPRIFLASRPEPALHLKVHGGRSAAWEGRGSPPPIGADMQRVCFVLHVKKDRIAEYKERHKNLWPEMREALQQTGWHNYSLFLREDGTLIGYVETPDFQK